MFLLVEIVVSVDLEVSVDREVPVLRYVSKDVTAPVTWPVVLLVDLEVAVD